FLAGLIEAVDDREMYFTSFTLLADTTLRADLIDWSGAVIGGGFALTLEPNDTTDAIVVGGAPGFAFDILTIDATELSLLTPNTFSALVIGRADGAHAITVHSLSFSDSLTIRTPLGGSVDVLGPISTTAG